jgi:hypothetical protein
MKIPAIGMNLARAGSSLSGEEMRGSAPPMMLQVASWSHRALPIPPAEHRLRRDLSDHQHAGIGGDLRLLA